MRPRVQCGVCLLNWIYQRSILEGMSGERLIAELLPAVEKGLHEEANLGILDTLAVRKAYEGSSFSSPYFETFKRRSNENAKSLLDSVRTFIEESTDEEQALGRALKIACAANVSPIGGPRQPYTFEEIKQVLKGTVDITIDPNILKKIKEATTVVYLADNAGEIGFDSILVDLLNKAGKRVVLFVKLAPFFDDATKEDANYFGLEKITEKIYEIPGYPLPSELEKTFGSPDLIISKGMGNYEALGEESLGIPILFMFKVKCVPIAKSTGSRLGDLKLILQE